MRTRLGINEVRCPEEEGLRRQRSMTAAIGYIIPTTTHVCASSLVKLAQVSALCESGMVFAPPRRRQHELEIWAQRRNLTQSGKDDPPELCGDFAVN